MSATPQMGLFHRPARREPGLLGIVGASVRSSLSPPMQNAALRHEGLDARYLAFEIAPAQLRDLLRALRPLGFWGLNVTIPYKEAVVPWLDEVEPQAAAIGAVNTIVVGERGLVGHNTDAEGFRLALRDRGRADVRGQTVLVVGAGGAARAVAYACLAGGCETLTLANRTPGRVRTLRRDLRRLFPRSGIQDLPSSGAAFREVAAASRIIVNATPLGSRASDPLPVPAGILRRGQVVMDIVYRPRRTPLLAAAAAAGARTVDGLGMLLYQGALSFRLWTGCEPPREVMRRALMRAAASPSGSP